MDIKGILFDKDGVLVDFDKTWAPALKVIARQLANGDRAMEQSYLMKAGYDPSQDIFLPGSIWAAGNTQDLVTAWLPEGSAQEREEMAAQVDGYCAKCDPVPLLPLDELQSIFGSLKARGFQLAIATNDVEISARNTMTRFGIAEQFDLIMGYDSVERPKPAADPVLKFADLCGVEAIELAMVGDNLHDAEMARAAGAGVAIGVLSGNSTRSELNGHVDHIVKNVAEVEALLMSLAQ